MVVSQGKLIEAGWGERNNITSINTLYQTVLTLRNALAEVGLPRDLIKTVARRGMMIFADITSEEDINAVQLDETEIEVYESVTQTEKEASIRFTVVGVALVLSMLCVAIGTSLSAYHMAPESLFSSYTILDSTSFSSCTLLLKGQSTINTQYIHFLDRNNEICHDHNYVYLSGMSSANNIAAIACQKDIRKERASKCTIWYSINEKN